MKIQNLMKRRKVFSGLVALTFLSLPYACNNGCATYGAQEKTSNYERAGQEIGYQFNR